MEKGWIKLHRMLKDKPLWLKSTPEQKVILITLLLMANHVESEWEWLGTPCKVKPGQFITSLESIQKEAGKGISTQNVRSSLKRFKKLEFLTEKSSMTGRRITICNWESYQKKEAPAQQSNQQRPNKEVTPNKNDKNNKKEISDIFDEFRIAYPGTKRGLQTELDNFLKINKPETVHLLLPALKKEIVHRSKLESLNQFVPIWKNLSTWINQKCWEQEFQQINGYHKLELEPAKGLSR